ncbi:uncharacterized protein LOC116118597 [Pistacia vera]|uniref:uncharacterized protein LOC116118597 n=1 Tax=Pistacia vera TaxID=55513 RepID=UPI0012637E9E|nr:uncharacterized protein LOC116118597 [Pistacia vera]
MADSTLTSLWESFSLTEEEENDVVVSNKTIEDVAAKVKHCLLALLITEKNFSKEAFRSTMSQVWKLEGWIHFTDAGEKLFLLEFQNVTDLQKVLNGRPWSFDRALIAIQRVDSSTPSNASCFTHEPFWVQLHNMPFAAMNDDYGVQLASAIGKVLEVDVGANGLGWRSFLRVKVEVELTKPLVRGRLLRIGEQKYWIAFKYERLQNFCFKCGVLKHKNRGCSSIRQTEESSNQFEPWL